MALFCAAIRRDSVSLLRFSFHNHVHAFSCAISIVCRLSIPLFFWSVLLLPILLSAAVINRRFPNVDFESWEHNLLLLLLLLIIIIIIIYSLESSSLSWWFLLEFEWQQVSRTLPSILADVNKAVVCMVSTCHLIPKSSSPFTNPLVTVPSAPITTGITVVC